MVYASQYASLAALEVLVHVSSSTLPPDLMLVTITLPDNASLDVIDKAQLASGYSLGMIETEYNILINSRHPEMENVKIVSVSSFNIGDRLIK